MMACHFYGIVSLLRKVMPLLRTGLAITIKRALESRKMRRRQLSGTVCQLSKVLQKVNIILAIATIMVLVFRKMGRRHLSGIASLPSKDML